ncbi:hypothetical protein [Streptomyces sp. NPDC058614]|uniref:hypothetical protein n=1 Tax=Streptomyces sp. NPDC058614 TaxID=3346557 RepID=UPI00365EEB80
MALITNGDFSDFSVEATLEAQGTRAWINQIDSFRTMSQVSRGTPGNSFQFHVSPEPRGLAVASIRLEKGFQNFMERLFNRDSDIYFMAWCWDLSGQPVSHYPANAENPGSCLIPLSGGELREFIGSGALLFPARPVTAGLAVRIQVWESDQATRDFGKTLAAVSKQIQDSKLNSLLSTIGMVLNVTTATVALVENAALELGQVIGTVLQATSDDYVDFYEGYYPASTLWSPGEEVYQGANSEIALSLFS